MCDAFQEEYVDKSSRDLIFSNGMSGEQYMMKWLDIAKKDQNFKDSPNDLHYCLSFPDVASAIP